MAFVSRCELCGEFFPLPELSCSCQLCRERSTCDGCTRTMALLGAGDPLAAAEVTRAVCDFCPLCREGAGPESRLEDDPAELRWLLERLGLAADVSLCAMTMLGNEVDPANPRFRGGIVQSLYALPEALPDILADAPPEWTEYPFGGEDERRRQLDERRELLAEGRVTPTGTPTSALVPPGGPPTGEGGKPPPIPDPDIRPPRATPTMAPATFLVRVRAWLRGKAGYYESRWDLIGKRRRDRLEDLDPDRVGDLRALLDLVRERARRGRPPGKVAYPTEASYRAAFRSLYERAAKQRWDLRNAAVCSDEWIADQLGISTTTLYERNDACGISMRDIREGRV